MGEKCKLLLVLVVGVVLNECNNYLNRGVQFKVLVVLSVFIYM